MKKRGRNPDTNNKSIKPAYRNGIYPMLMIKKGKRNNGRNNNTKLGKHQNSC